MLLLSMEKITSFSINKTSVHLYLLKDNRIAVHTLNKVLFYFEWPKTIELGKKIDKIVLEAIIGKISTYLTK